MNGKKLEDLKDDFRFWTGLYDDEYFKWASDKAYLDMNRTIHFEEKVDSKKRLKLREHVTEQFENKFKELGEKKLDFRNWHKRLCEIIGKEYNNNVYKTIKNKTIHTLTYGQIQKWINMTLKYLWLIDRLKIIPEDNEIHKTLLEYKEEFDIPLDSYILRYADRAKYNKNTPNYTNLAPINNIKSYEWSNITEYETYKNYQEKIKNAILDKDKIPLEWELEHWHKAIKFYNKNS